MQNKVIIFGKITEQIEEFLHERGIFDALSCFSFEDCCNLCNETCVNCKNVVVLCKNEFIDELVERVKTSDDVLSLINDQAVKIERQTTFKTMLLVPIEADYRQLLDNFLPQKNLFVCMVFGKSEKFLKEKLLNLKNTSERDLEFQIIEIGQFLHIVYSSKQLSEELFEGGLYSNKRQSLAQALKDILAEKTLSVAENMTAGTLTKKIAEGCKTNLAGVEIICSDKDFDRLGMDQLYLEQNGSVSKETVFDMAKNLLRNKKTDLAVAITGFDCDAGRSFVAVGNREQIHVYSSTFYGERDEIVENATNFALFKTICFLKEKYQ